MRVQEVPLLGRKFTWARGKSRSKLDRAFIDQEWSFKFPDLNLKALPNTISDHAPIPLSLAAYSPGVRPFRSIDVWFLHLDFTKLVREEWRALGNMPIHMKLKALQLPLRKWNRETFGNIDDAIKKFEVEQLLIQEKIDLRGGDEGKLLEAAFQRHWITGGDRNTKYFHAVALTRRRVKRMELIKSGGGMLKKPRGVKIAMLKFFKELYRQKPAPAKNSYGYFSPSKGQQPPGYNTSVENFVR
ncbi:uncharacterized protein LOC125221151 [Salvia hispanica]|uniref:uncharacterized protein LOC125221151 n=1 Tax=Salvia hispanica TaxID=49212 RepID=UPI002009913E|nr:uncharacterized protein LOC125221151 [Salvia hispanica]